MEFRGLRISKGEVSRVNLQWEGQVKSKSIRKCGDWNSRETCIKWVQRAWGKPANREMRPSLTLRWTGAVAVSSSPRWAVGGQFSETTLGTLALNPPGERLWPWCGSTKDGEKSVEQGLLRWSSAIWSKWVFYFYELLTEVEHCTQNKCKQQTTKVLILAVVVSLIEIRYFYSYVTIQLYLSWKIFYIHTTLILWQVLSPPLGII